MDYVLNAQISTPVLLTPLHDVAKFDCGKPALNNWLQRYALSNQRHGFTRVLAACIDNRVVGFYGLTQTAVDPSLMPRRIRTGQPPKAIPAILIAQFAVDTEFAGRGLGSSMLRHALDRALRGVELLGGRVILVDAIDEDAEAYWIANGFEPIIGNRSTLFSSISAVERWLDTPGYVQAWQATRRLL